MPDGTFDGGGVRMTLRGMDDTRKQLERIHRATANMAKWKAVVGTRLPYGYGIETGRHRVSGKLARAAGGSMYLQRAVEAVLNEADRDLAEGLNKVTAPGKWVLNRLALWARRLAKANAPRGPRVKTRSYRLRRSIRKEVRRR